MPEFLRGDLQVAAMPLAVFGRLGGAALLGAVVAWIYQRTRPPSDTSSSLAVTLVLLSILIAMVTQVIGDNVARAFSLVGALSIVRFRTVVRDTVDTAFVIFAVAIGMAAGANNTSVALSGIARRRYRGLVHDPTPDGPPESRQLSAAGEDWSRK